MPHKVSQNLIDSMTCGPSDSKKEQVKNLHNFIQELLSSTHHTFLQGSYRNHTAIRDINDVDIVAVRNNTYSGTHSPHASPESDKIQWDAIFAEIEAILRTQRRYTWTMTRGEKCIKLRGAIDVDVVPAVQYHQVPTNDPVVVNSSRGDSISHPRAHIANTKLKNDNTQEKYRPVVRMFKNWIFNHFDKDVVSSFKIQALVHSIDNDEFFDDHVANFIIIGDSILEKLRPTNPLVMSVCGNEDIISGWDINSRNLFIAQLEQSVENARNAYNASTISDADYYWRQVFNI